MFFSRHRRLSSSWPPRTARSSTPASPGGSLPAAASVKRRRSGRPRSAFRCGAIAELVNESTTHICQYTQEAVAAGLMSGSMLGLMPSQRFSRRLFRVRSPATTSALAVYVYRARSRVATCR
eukprot:7687977-Pyramimonas_sp.AAC.1